MLVSAISFKKYNLMKRIIILFLVFCLCGLTFAKEKKAVLKTVDSVEIERCMGTWYEIARITHWFEKGLQGVGATYTLLPNGNIEMINSGFKGSLQGKYKSATGKAWITDKNSNAKLKASFFWPFRSQYWILDIGKKYEYAVIGNPNMKYLWVLSRTPTMDEELYKKVLKRAGEQGYDISLLEKAEPRIIDNSSTKKNAE